MNFKAFFGKTAIRITAAASAFCISLCCTSCSSRADAEEVVKKNPTLTVSEASVMTTSSQRKIDQPQLFSNWNGSEITLSVAKENDLVYCENGSIDNIWLWDDFAANVMLEKPAQVCIASGNTLTLADYYGQGSGQMKFTLIRKTADGENIKSQVSTVSGTGITTVRTDSGTEYSIGEFSLMTLSSDNTDYIEVPFESKIYRADNEANMSLPLYKTFASYKDFQSYFDDYNDELDLSAMQKDMKAYDKDGGFNAHVVFLCADLEVSDSVEYSVRRAVKGDGTLEIYLKKSVTPEKCGSMGKWQTVVKIPSEYLNDVSPDNIKWIIYTQQDGQ